MNRPSVFRTRTFKMYFMAFMLPVLIMFTIIILKGIYPFGDRCFLRSDLYNQYLPFFSELQGKLLNGESVHYAWELGLGSNFMGLYAYYLASPLNFLVVFIPKQFLIEFMTLLIILKIGFCGFSLCYYFTRHFQKKKYSMVCFSLFYALSGYLAAYNWNIMWLDCIALAPLIVWGLEHLVKDKSWRFYSITLGISILVNYYISIMICLFLVLYFMILVLYLPWKEKLRAFWQFAGSSVLAAGFAGVVLIPGLLAITGTGFSQINFPDEVENYFSILEVLARHCVNVSTEIKNDHWPNLYCGVGVMFLLPFYVMCRQISWKEKVPKLIFLAFFVVSFSNNVLNFIWHGLNYPDSLPCRQSFLYILVLLTVCYEAFLHIRECRLYELGISLAVTAVFLGICVLRVNHEDFKNQAFLLTFVFVTAYVVMGICYRYQAVTFKVLTVCVTLLVIFEVALNTYNTSVSTVTRSKYMNNYEKDLVVSSWLSKVDDDFYRIEQSDRTTKNDGALSGFKTATIFSSTTNGSVINFYKEMGMDYSKVYYNFDGATPLTTALLDVRYLLTGADEDWMDPYHQLISTDGEVSVYKNQNALSVGFVLPENLEENWDYTEGSAIDSQNNLALALGVEEPLFTELPTENADSDDISVILSAESEGNLYVRVRGATSKNGDKATMTVTDAQGNIVRTRSFKNVRKGFLLNAGRCNAGDTITFKPTVGSWQDLDVYAYQLNDGSMQETLALLGQEQLTNISYTPDTLQGEITLQKPGRLVLSVPDESGWNLYIDGSLYEKKTFADTFIAADLSQGTHTVSIVYHASGSTSGIMVSLICFAIFGAISCKRSKKSVKCNQ